MSLPNPVQQMDSYWTGLNLEKLRRLKGFKSMLWMNQMLDARAHKQKYILMYHLKYFFLNLQKSRGKYQFPKM